MNAADCEFAVHTAAVHTALPHDQTFLKSLAAIVGAHEREIQPRIAEAPKTKGGDDSGELIQDFHQWIPDLASIW